MEHFVGFIASTISFVMFMPQAMRTWSMRGDSHALLGVSIAQQWLIVANASLWFVYGWMTEAFWVAAPGFVNLPLAVFSIVLIFKARRGFSAQEVHDSSSASPHFL